MMLQKLQSRKFLTAVALFILIGLDAVQVLNLDNEHVQWLVTVGLSYIGVEGVGDIFTRWRQALDLIDPR
jgi:hypothetical protein